jgi:hypothetical protein
MASRYASRTLPVSFLAPDFAGIRGDDQEFVDMVEIDISWIPVAFLVVPESSLRPEITDWDYLALPASASTAFLASARAAGASSTIHCATFEPGS